MNGSKAPAEEISGGRSGKSPLTWMGLALVVPAWALFLLEALVIKAMEVRQIEGEIALVPTVQAWAPDLLFALGVALPAVILVSLLGPRLKWLAAVPYFLLIAASMTLQVASIGFFVSTGANLSWSGIEYWARNYEEVSRVVAGEGSDVAYRFLLAYGQLGLVLLVAVIPNLPAAARRLRGAPAPRTSAAILGAGFLVAAAAAAVPKAGGPAMAACQCVPVSILSELVFDRLLPQEEVEIAEEERLDASLVLEKNPAKPRRNVVLIMFESLRWKSSDAYTPGLGLTPTLAGLAAEGLLVEQQYTVLPHTTKALVPINCGIYPYLDTTAKETLPGILPRRCLAHILRSQGYKTAFFQPAANFEKRDQLVANMGYEVFRGLQDLPQEGFEDTNYFGKEERIMLRPSLEWVDSVKDGPFLLTYLTLCTHHNYISPQSYPYVDYPVSNDDERNYMNAVRYTDEFVGDLFREFRDRGLMDNTLFIIVGDHGEAFGEHGGWQHDLVMWEEGLRSFSLLLAPGALPRGERITGIRSHLDLVPTVCDFLGLELKQGEFLGSSLLRPAPEGRKLFHACWYKRRCLAMHEGALKTIYHYGLKPPEVYDNAVDFFDESNLAFSGAFDETFLSRNQGEMTRWERVVNQQYEAWEEGLSDGVVSEEEPPVANRLHARFGDAIELVGWESSLTEVPAGRNVRLKYVFRALQPLSSQDKLFVHVMHDSGFLNEDHEPANGTLPLERWAPGRYVIDEHLIHIPGTWKSGEARIAVGFWNKATKKRYPVTDTSGEVDQNRLVVTGLGIRAGGKAPTMTLEQRREKIKQWIGFAAPKFQQAAHMTFGGKIELVGLDLARMDVELAGTVEMTYVFKALARIPANWRLTVELLRDDGVSIKADHVPIGGLYPPKDWREGEYVVDRHRIHIDMHLCKPGTYTAYLGFEAGGRPVPAAGSLATDARGRVALGTVIIARGPQK